MKRKEGKDKIFVKGKLIILEDNTEIKNFFTRTILAKEQLKEERIGGKKYFKEKYKFPRIII